MDDNLAISSNEFDRLTYKRLDLDREIIDCTALANSCPLDNGRLGIDGRSTGRSQKPLGALDSLPLELLHNILQSLDLQSLTALRAVNIRSRTIIDSYLPYKTIVSHAPNSIRALLGTQLASHFTSQQIYNTLCSDRCFLCGDTGPFLYLLSCSRVCFPCIIDAPELLPITSNTAKEAYALDTASLRSLPTLRSLPGVYSQLWIKSPKRIQLVEKSVAQAAGVALHGSSQAMEDMVTHRKQEQAAAYETRKARAATNPSIKCRTPSCFTQRFDSQGANTHRFLGIMRFPSLNRVTSRLEWSSSCNGCRGTSGQSMTRRWTRMFTQDTFKDHIKDCEPSRRSLVRIRDSMS
ncbi:MAG: hypothetical protein M1836_003324 [Candelina mexicana]|nr:MAG: hypothetical protein M1836_003324 [Candelina mexicana]